MARCSAWQHFADLTIEEAAYLMVGVDLKMLRYRDEHGAADNNDLSAQGLFEDAAEIAKEIISQVRVGRIGATQKVLCPETQQLSAQETHISLKDFLEWCDERGRSDISELFPLQRAQATERSDSDECEPIKSEHASNYPWIPAARSIYRELKAKHPRANLETMAEKVHQEMEKRKISGQSGMTGRGNRVPSSETIKRHALINIG